MKRTSTIGLAIMLMASIALAGLVTNTNQSAEYIRTLNRNASTCVDAAYYNPAGLTKLPEGLHFAISNQSIFQTKEIDSDLATLNSGSFTGDVKAMVFPDVHVAYKMGKMAFSGSFMPIGGGGGAEYSTGLPSFEYNYAGLVGVPAGALNAQLAALGNITGYEADIEFSGASVYFAGQANAAYAINDMISVAVGGRYIMANNTLEGSIKNVSLSTEAGMPLTSAVIPNFADIEMDIAQTGTAFGALIGANIAPMEGLNVGIRYELQTALTIENETEVDGSGLFPDGAETPSDMPALLGLGASYMVMPNLRTELSMNYFMNTSADWDGAEDETENGFDVGAGIEYGISDALSASAGFLYSKSGALEGYRSDASLNLDALAAGFGVGYKLMDNLALNVGGLVTFYTEATKTLPAQMNTLVPVETFNQSTFLFAIGIRYSL
ncbi:OmpP1/FadL family transporter [Candidatus Neomarinimicrobiota bacterium]